MHQDYSSELDKLRIEVAELHALKAEYDGRITDLQAEISMARAKIQSLSSQVPITHEDQILDEARR
jgi:peptidoglycan hydrolase CwlO-like protein